MAAMVSLLALPGKRPLCLLAVKAGRQARSWQDRSHLRGTVYSVSVEAAGTCLTRELGSLVLLGPALHDAASGSSGVGSTPWLISSTQYHSCPQCRLGPA